MNMTKLADTDEKKYACYDWMAYWNRPEVVVDFCLQISAPVHLKAGLLDERVQNDEDQKIISNFEGREAWNWVPNGFTHANEVTEQMLDAFEAIAMGGDVREVLTKTSGFVDEIIEGANQERAAG